MTTRAETDHGPRFLRGALYVDGWSTGVFGALLLATAPILRKPLGLPVSWSIPFGVVMLVGAAALLLLAGRAEVPVRAVRAVVTVNALSAIGMVGLTGTALLPLTEWGRVFLYSGALFVAVFAGLEYVGLRWMRR
ncbi:hypothetical protein FOH10_17960 [Nocardia otitidiscaviarum]|uniref:Uncharacterized protein n=2 Tax=Nocardia otitidiscaviarum TaxID=1823 RepID=A0A516NXC6_9NOCA|nr:hypothetical protein [Nocardia otitidiscaviarum]QDP83572.1 hypothetical protein FOH10_17960 [Nocardia otitidiscaviarum]